MTARHRARKRALDVLFEADLRQVPIGEALAETEARRGESGDPPLNPYTVEVVRGVADHRERIDEILATYSLGWTLDRMPAVDRNILRIGVFELLWGEIPDAVAIDEAVELARELSTDESPAFINGLLSRVRDERASLIAAGE